MATNNSNSGFAIHQIKEVLVFQASEDLKISGVTIPKGYVNVTQLCKANGKKLSHWNNLKRSKAYLEALSMETGIPASMLLVEIEGTTSGRNATFQGTFAHPEVAISIAAWISPEFEVWGNRVIRAVINNDFKALTPEAEKAQKQLQTIWEELRIAGIIKRNFFTDAIKVYLENNDVSVDYIRWIYPNCSDAVNKALFGKSAKKLCEERNCDHNHLRDTHNSKDLDRIATIEKHAEKLILKFNTEPLQAIKEAIAFYED